MFVSGYHSMRGGDARAEHDRGHRHGHRSRAGPGPRACWARSAPRSRSSRRAGARTPPRCPSAPPAQLRQPVRRPMVGLARRVAPRRYRAASPGSAPRDAPGDPSRRRRTHGAAAPARRTSRRSRTSRTPRHRPPRRAAPAQQHAPVGARLGDEEAADLPHELVVAPVTAAPASRRWARAAATSSALAPTSAS